MSTNDFIRDLLEIKDPNITITHFSSETTYYQNLIYKVVRGKLTYQPECCYHCGTMFDKDIVKHGFKTSTVRLADTAAHPTMIKLSKQRYFCRHCRKTFTLTTNVVDKHCCISNAVKQKIALDSKKVSCEKDIASTNRVSHSTVNRIINTAYSNYHPDSCYLPKHLCFDEFKSVKEASGAMSFIFCDADTHDIIDIVENRQLPKLRNYFNGFTRKARLNVETIVIDLYSPYISLICECFPKAKIIFDRFHVVGQFNRAFNKTRIMVMKRLPEHQKKLKKYWKLLMKQYTDLDQKSRRYSYQFQEYLTSKEIVDRLLTLDDTLRETYHVYQDVMTSIKLKNSHLLWATIYRAKTNPFISDYMKVSLKTMNRYKEYVSNAIAYTYSNGVIEGINNKIKVLKRVAYGYRSFIHFRNRILLMHNMLKLKTG